MRCAPRRTTSRLPLQQGLHVQMTLPATKQYRSDGLGNELLNAGRTCRLLNRTCIPWRGYAARGPHAQHIKPMFCAPLTIPKFQATRAILILEMIVKSLGALLLSALAASGAAFAVPVETRDVYSPKVLYPHSGTVWYSGQRHNVTWDNSNPPQNISNRAFIIMRQNNIEIPGTSCWRVACPGAHHVRSRACEGF